MNLQKIIISVLFIAIGAGLIWYGFSRPCDIGAIVQKTNSNVEVEQPLQLDKLVCLSSDYYSMISVLVGTAMIFPGISGLFRGLTESAAANGKKKKKRR